MIVQVKVLVVPGGHSAGRGRANVGPLVQHRQARFSLPFLGSMLGDSDSSNYRHRCVDCGTLSPSTQTNYTLISSQHGWRLARGVDPSGTPVMEWRCPKCWSKRKEQLSSDPKVLKRESSG